MASPLSTSLLTTSGSLQVLLFPVLQRSFFLKDSTSGQAALSWSLGRLEPVFSAYQYLDLLHYEKSRFQAYTRAATLVQFELSPQTLTHPLCTRHSRRSIANDGSCDVRVDLVGDISLLPWTGRNLAANGHLEASQLTRVDDLSLGLHKVMIASQNVDVGVLTVTTLHFKFCIRNGRTCSGRMLSSSCISTQSRSVEVIGVVSVTRCAPSAATPQLSHASTGAAKLWLRPAKLGSLNHSDGWLAPISPMK